MSDISVTTLGDVTSGLPPAQSEALRGVDKDMFLDLLVAQMKYQNPMNPSDSSEFMNQAAQYASVEQLEQLANSQAELRALQMVTLATEMVGKTVLAADPATGEAVTGTVDAVRFVGSEPVIVVGGIEIPVSNVSELGPAAAATAPVAPRTPDAVAPGTTPGAGAPGPVAPRTPAVAPDPASTQEEAINPAGAA